MTYEMTSSSLTYPLNFTDDPIEASAEEQKGEALFTVTGRCWQKLELAFESRIRDGAGNLSEPVLFTMSCTTPPPLDTRAFLVSGLGTALPIALLLLLGFWLLFRKRPAERLPALRSMILMFFLFMLLRFLQLVVHEGGHSLYLLVRGVPITLYVHPFMFDGFSRPIIDSSIWKDILGSATAIPVGLLISLLLLEAPFACPSPMGDALPLHCTERWLQCDGDNGRLSEPGSVHRVACRSVLHLGRD